MKCVKFCHKQNLEKKKEKKKKEKKKEEEKMKLDNSVSNVKGLGGRKCYPQGDNLD